MKNLANILAGIGILLIAYAVIGKLTAMPFINFGIVKTFPFTCLIMANSLMLIAVLIKLSSK